MLEVWTVTKKIVYIVQHCTLEHTSTDAIDGEQNNNVILFIAHSFATL